MRNFWKGAGRVVALTIGAKVIAELVKCCRKRKERPASKDTADYSNSKYIQSQLVVWKKPEVSDAEFNEWKTKNLKTYGGIHVKKLCKNCDDTLELWEGNNVSTFISEKVASSGGSSSGGPPHGGGDGIAFYSYNLIIDLPDPDLCLKEPNIQELKMPDRQTSADPAIIVAVFDTGILPAIKTSFTNPVDSCMRNGDSGWNFAYKNDITDDDYPSMHGSAVAKFIIDQADEYRKQKISILPVKVHNNSGKSDLFSILCGFAYAANGGAKIINASFGFYSSKGSEAPAILTHFVKKHLTHNNILLIAAAGNVNADESIGRFTTEYIRNLEYHPFFPACLAKNFENVLTITTICLEKGEVSPSQNFANEIVDIGVDCDIVIDNDFRFKDSLNRSTYVLGSSYATPIVTGKIAQHYNELIRAMPGGIINKSLLIEEMVKLGIVKIDPRFIDRIRDGNYATKRK